jgi:hypothetical protein
VRRVGAVCVCERPAARSRRPTAQCSSASKPATRRCVHRRRHVPSPSSPPQPAGELPLRKWDSFNSPSLQPKFLRHAERVARELGVTDELAAFDEAAAAFPNPTPVYAAT